MKSGILILFLLLALTGILFLLSKVGGGTENISLMLWAGQLSGLWGAVLLASSFVLSSRASFLESLLGGLDKVTKIHQRVGVAAFSLLAGHPVLLALSEIPDFSGGLKYFWLGNNVAYNLGIAALQIMILVLIFTFLIGLPYNHWIRTHDMMGVALLLAGGHVWLIPSDVGRYMPLRIWMLGILTIGLGFYLYKLVYYRHKGPKYQFLVEKINELGNVAEIYLLSKGAAMNYRPGQFGFVNFSQKGFEEAHPFSFSSAPGEKAVRLSVKMSGDYTSKLKSLKPGTKATIWGPYGRTYNDFFGKKDVVGIAGGIGITPFLSLLAAEVKAPKERKIFLYYSVGSKDEAVYHQEIDKTQKKLNNLIYIPFFTGGIRRLTVKEMEKTSGGIEGKLFFLCGPLGMMEDIKTQLKQSGVEKVNIYSEDFNLL